MHTLLLILTAGRRPECEQVDLITGTYIYTQTDRETDRHTLTQTRTHKHTHTHTQTHINAHTVLPNQQWTGGLG